MNKFKIHQKFFSLPALGQAVVVFLVVARTKIIQKSKKKQPFLYNSLGHVVVGFLVGLVVAQVVVGAGVGAGVGAQVVVGAGVGAEVGALVVGAGVGPSGFGAFFKLFQSNRSSRHRRLQ
jgi:hypothetical protein